jgi:hypothetical protein
MTAANRIKLSGIGRFQMATESVLSKVPLDGHGKVPEDATIIHIDSH